MSKRTIYTNITPLPHQVTRQIALDELRDHGMMIKLNPLVLNFERTAPHKEAPADEYHCVWYEITDQVSYLPGIKGQVKYKACFYDRPTGLQTHCYAPAGLDIKAKWSVGGNMPGEPREARELGLETPRDGLYLREDVDMHCNIMLTGFVKKNLKTAHAVLVNRLVKKVEYVEEGHYQRSMAPSSTASSVISPPPTPGAPPQQSFPQRSGGSVILDDKSTPASLAYPSPTMPDQQYSHTPSDDIFKAASPPPLYWRSSEPKGDWKTPSFSQRSSYGKPSSRPESGQHYVAELPGSESMPAMMYSPPPSTPRFSRAQNAPQELDTTPRYLQK